MHINTFGKTPAALYLVRTLNYVNSSTLTKSVGRRITSTSKSVTELINAYQNGSISPKTVANSLRLMRLELSFNTNRSESDHVGDLIEQLCSNVQIGVIKRGLRLCSVARKAERVMENPVKRASDAFVYGAGQVVEYMFVDSTNGAKYPAGAVFDGEYTDTFKIHLDDLVDTTPELLMERSNRRCLRQGKPHMVGK